MDKVQILKLELASGEKAAPAIFNPLNGRPLTSEDQENLETDYRNDPALMLVYAGDDIADGPLECHPDFEDHFQNLGFDKIEQESELEKLLDKIDDPYAYILMKVSISGSLPGDYGRMLFVLRIENISL